MNISLETTEFIVLNFVILLVALVGNALVISSICTLKEKTIYSLAKLSLAVADVLFVILSIILYTHYKLTNPLLFPGRIYLFTGVVLGCTSASHVCSMAIQRYYAITTPFKYSQITKKKQMGYLAVIWTLNLFLLVLLLGIPHLPTYLQLFLVICGSFVPLTLTIVSTLAMLFAYFRYVKHNYMQSSDETALSTQRNHSKVVRITLLITIGYIITCSPMVYVTICMAINDSLSIFTFHVPVLSIIANELYMLSNVVDVIVYGFSDAQFQKHVKCVLRKLISCGVCEKYNGVDVTNNTRQPNNIKVVNLGEHSP